MGAWIKRVLLGGVADFLRRLANRFDRREVAAEAKANTEAAGKVETFLTTEAQNQASGMQKREASADAAVKGAAGESTAQVRARIQREEDAE